MPNCPCETSPSQPHQCGCGPNCKCETCTCRTPAGAKTTDFIIPYGMLKSSGVADVRSLSTTPGPIRMRMSLTVMADQTLAQFDAAEPRGADIVIVPAQAAPADAALNAWVRRQAA